MFSPRLKGDDIKYSKYYNRPYSTSDMPNCTTYALMRICEILDRQCAQNLGGSRIPDPIFQRDGYDDAHTWYRDWLWKKGQVPKLGAVACWSGINKKTGKPCAGHVAVVEVIYNDGSFLTSNSNYGGAWFYTKTIGADKVLKSELYDFKFEGFCYIPLEVVERDENKYQVKVNVDGLRIRSEHSITSNIIGVCNNGELFNVEAIYEDGTYKWLDIGDGWIGTIPEWVTEFEPALDVEQLKKENKELKLVNAYLKDMVNTCEIKVKELIDKIEKIKEVVK